MSTIKRARIIKLAAAAYEIDLDVADGPLTRDEEGHWKIGDRKLDEWLTKHEGSDLVLIMGAIPSDQPLELRTCYTCGRDYTDLECPYCRESRLRLRGQS